MTVDQTPVVELLGPSTGGIRAHVAELSGRLAERGWAPTVAGPPGVMGGVGHQDGVVPVPAGSDPRGFATARAALAQLVTERRPALIHAHGLKAGWVAVSLRRRPPVVVSVHNLVLAEATGRAFRALRALEAALPARADAVIAVSDEVARRFTGLAGAGRIRVVPPVGPAPRPTRPVAEVRAELGVPTDGHLLVTAARLHPQKGLDVLVDAVAQLAERTTGLRAVVFGVGPLEVELRRRIDRLHLGGTVLLAGSRPTIADELAAADVVVVPSRWESGPLVVFEAAQLGVPVVSTPVGAVPRVVEDGRTGRLVPVGDAAALAAAVAAMLDDPEAAGRMARSARELARERFGPGALVDGVQAVYVEVLGDP